MPVFVFAAFLFSQASSAGPSLSIVSSSNKPEYRRAAGPPYALAPILAEVGCASMVTIPSGRVAFARSRKRIVGLTRLSSANALGGTSIRCVLPETAALWRPLPAPVGSAGSAIEPPVPNAPLLPGGPPLDTPVVVPSASDDTKPGTDAFSERFSESSNGLMRRDEALASVSENLNSDFDGSRTGRPTRSVSLMEAMADRDDVPPFCSSMR